MIGTLPPATPVQYCLPAIPKTDASALPVHMALKRACVTRFVESGWLSIGASILPVVQRMKLDDVLYFNDMTWRLERVWLNKGYPHFRLYWMPKKHYVFGIADMRSDTQLPTVQQHVAAYIAAFGAAASDLKLVEGVAWTPLNADTSRQYRLFKVKG